MRDSAHSDEVTKFESSHYAGMNVTIVRVEKSGESKCVLIRCWLELSSLINFPEDILSEPVS